MICQRLYIVENKYSEYSEQNKLRSVCKIFINEEDNKDNFIDSKNGAAGFDDKNNVEYTV